MHPLACELREIWCKYLHLRARAEALLLGLPLTTTITYTYDELYRLTDATYSSYDTDKTYSYTYDAVGNALSYSTNVNNLVTTTNYTYNAANQLMTAQVNNNPTVWNYTHDGRGNLTEVTPNGTPGIGAQRYTYNTAGYLSQVENYNGSAYELRAEMSYNGLGDRISMTGWESGLSLTTNYTLDLTRYAQPLSATAAGNSTFYLYGRDAAAEKTDAWAYYLKDGTTTTRQMTGPAAEVLVVRGFTPWGEITYQNGIDDLAWGYFGGLMDAATGLIYMGAGQYYDPSTGRFLSPVNNFDPENPGNPYLPSSGDPLGAMLGPVALLLLLSGRRKKKGKVDKLLLLLLMSMAVVMGVVACGEGPAPTPPPPSSTSPPPQPPSESTKPPPSTPTQTPPCNNCVAYLTFDDGPDPSSLTLSIATELARNQIRATFFFSGTDFNSSWTRVELTCDEYSNTINEYDLVEGGVEQNTSQAAAIEGMGHASGIHGWLHQPWPDGMDADIQIGHEISELNKVGSHPENFQLLRAPYGGFPKVCEGSNCRDLPIGGYENWYYYNWTIDSCDAAFSEKECIRPVNSAADIVANVAYGLGFDPEKPFRGQSGVHPERNPIILLHSIKNSTANSILQNLGNEKLNLITALREMGYTTFMSLPRPGDNRGIPVIGGNR